MLLISFEIRILTCDQYFNSGIFLRMIDIETVNSLVEHLVQMYCCILKLFGAVSFEYIDFNLVLQSGQLVKK